MFASRKPVFADRLIVFLAAVAARAGILVWAKSAIPDLFRWSLDSWEYMGMMLAIRDWNWGFYMFTLRPPGYSLLLTGFNRLFHLRAPQMLAFLPFQALLTSLSAVIAMHIIYRLTKSRSLSILGGLVLALDPMMVGAEAPILSEALFNPALIVSQLFLLRWLSKRRWRDFVICLVALQLMVLTRATGMYYITVILAVIIAYDRRLWRFALLLLAGFSLPILVWTARNIYYTGISTYSTAASYNLLFYKAVSTELLRSDKSAHELAWDYANELERRLGNPPPTVFPVGNYDYLYPQDADRYKMMTKMGFEKLREFHVLHLVKVPWTIYSHFSRNETLKSLIRPGIQIPLTLLSLSIFALGGVEWIREKRPLWQHIFILGTGAYFMLGTGFFMAGNTASRYMSALGVCWALLIALGLRRIIRWMVRFRIVYGRWSIQTGRDGTIN